MFFPTRGLHKIVFGGCKTFAIFLHFVAETFHVKSTNQYTVTFSILTKLDTYEKSKIC